MKRPSTLAALLALALAGAVAQAGETASKAREASIAFANSGASIREWQADGESGLWVQDAHRQWYYAKLNGPCQGLDFALRVGFQTHAADTLDRFGSVVVPNYGRCPIQSFTRSEAPPERKPKGGSEAG